MAGVHTDAMIERLEKEIEERSSFIEGVIGNAQDADRDLTDNEKELTVQARGRIEACEDQLNHLYEARERTTKARQRAQDVHREIDRLRDQVDHGPVEYRTAGEYALDAYKAHLGNREAQERLEVFYRAAAHQKTGDNLGVVPDPIIGNVVNFVDAARPMVNAVGPQAMPAATWHRPLVTQQASVAAQGTAGAAADEKAELVSQKMTLSRLTANAVTYGGYVNVSRQNIDFSQPAVLDIVINSLAQQYAIQTEAALGTELDASTATAVGYGASPTAATIAAAIWAAAADVYTAVKGQGQLYLALSPSKLEQFGPLFVPVNPQNAQSEGLMAGNFRSGTVGAISGVPVIMSAGLATGKVFLFSTAAIEVFEQRVGTLQVTEPSVLGVQVAYAGYFTPLTILDGGIIELTAT